MCVFCKMQRQGTSAYNGVRMEMRMNAETNGVFLDAKEGDERIERCENENENECRSKRTTKSRSEVFPNLSRSK